MKLPHFENAVVPQTKVTRYLLNAEHPRGKDKAAFFTRFEFSLAEWEVMRDKLLIHAAAHEVANILETPEGIHYAVDGELETPDGRNPHVRTVWALDIDSTTPRLITSYPLK